jgi:hypothetical protein
MPGYVKCCSNFHAKATEKSTFARCQNPSLVLIVVIVKIWNFTCVCDTDVIQWNQWTSSFIRQHYLTELAQLSRLLNLAVIFREHKDIQPRSIWMIPKVCQTFGTWKNQFFIVFVWIWSCFCCQFLVNATLKLPCQSTNATSCFQS